MFKENVMSWIYKNHDWINIAGYTTLIIGLIALNPALQ